ncbi:hydroxymethylglutaryl-CoA synthase [Microbacterium elymi]|uniref:Hydroxymethylglutaryl-CoA synthase n=1 Tax=Microbacterium elymi TaxID=2909587 RepID=A0ABY5NNH4_9MICO|nr:MULTISPECIES: hydroxymethylglutaryl-CoA synthase [Microbacterium]UUT36676.1 hydroxymethylglutaryl-CoA synthase [Microbacterium elymi]
MTATGMRVGIHDLAFATTHQVLDLRTLAEHQGIDVNKYYIGIGQTEMSVPCADEDIVTMGAEAAAQIVARLRAEQQAEDGQAFDGIRTLLFATESGVDQSKSAGVFVHSLLGLGEHCRVVELKQACYSATAALQFALGIVARDESEKVLVIASDVARYALDSSGEPTQGAAAVAFLVTADPALIEIEPVSGLHTDDIDDFWRPNHLSTALVDGKYSLAAYLRALEGAWTEYRSRGGVDFEAIDRFCYHQPFTKMAVKAHDKLSALVGSPLDKDQRRAQVAASLELNRRTGNSYTASIYVGLLSLLERDDADLAGRRIGFFSYGSGSVSEFFTGVVRPGYRDVLRTAADERALDDRTAIDHARYRALHEGIDAAQGSDYETAAETPGPFRFAGVSAQVRRYARTAGGSPA